MRESITQYCIRSGRQDLLIQWNSAKNGELSPEDVTYGSQKMVWWRCAQGHEWQSPPYARIGKENGCPFCAGKRLSQEIVLSTVYPELAEQWHPEKRRIDTGAGEQRLPAEGLVALRAGTQLAEQCFSADLPAYGLSLLRKPEGSARK